MERDNKKARDEARKEYNDTVRVGPPVSPVPAPMIQRSVAVARNVHTQTGPPVQEAPRESGAEPRYPARSANTFLQAVHIVRSAADFRRSGMAENGFS